MNSYFLAKVIDTILLLNPLTLSRAHSNYSHLNCDLSSPVLNELIRPRTAKLPNFLNTKIFGQEPQDKHHMPCEREGEEQRAEADPRWATWPQGHPNAPHPPISCKAGRTTTMSWKKEKQYRLEEIVILLHIFCITLERNVLFSLKKTRHLRTLNGRVKDQTRNAVLGGVRGDSNGQGLFMWTKGPRPTFHPFRRGPQAPKEQDILKLLYLAKANTDYNIIFALWTKDRFSIQSKMSKY